MYTKTKMMYVKVDELKIIKAILEGSLLIDGDNLLVEAARDRLATVLETYKVV